MAKEKTKKLWGATATAKKNIESGYDPFSMNKTTGCTAGKCQVPGTSDKKTGAKDNPNNDI